MTEVEARRIQLASELDLTPAELNELRDCEITLGMTMASPQARSEAARRTEARDLARRTAPPKSHAQIKREVNDILAGRHTRSSKKTSHATRKARRDAQIARNGSGDFLDPPEYPTHEYHVQTDLRRRPDNRGSMSLTYAVEEAPWLDSETKREAKALLDKWKTSRPGLNSQKVQDWIHQVLGYFKSAYRNPSAGAHQWDAAKLVFDDTRDPVLNADDHAGVRLIRKFYPDFDPDRQDFEGAYWGR